MLRRPAYVKPGQNHYETVKVNGYTFQLLTGQRHSLPEEVYLILVRSGKAEPVRPGDDDEVPIHMRESGITAQSMGTVSGT